MLRTAITCLLHLFAHCLQESFRHCSPSFFEFLSLFKILHSPSRTILDTLWISLTEIAFYDLIVNGCYGIEGTEDRTKPAADTSVGIPDNDIVNDAVGILVAELQANRILALETHDRELVSGELVSYHGNGCFLRVALSEFRE